MTIKKSPILYAVIHNVCWSGFPGCAEEKLKAEFSIGGGILGNIDGGYAGQAGEDLEPFPENRRLLDGEIFQIFLARIYTSSAWVRLLTYPILYPKPGDP